MNLIQPLTASRGRALPWTLVALAALGAYGLISVSGVARPFDPGQAVAAAPTSATASLQAVGLGESVRSTGLSAQAEDAAKRAALPAEQPPTF
jgi:hypothetical protein